MNKKKEKWSRVLPMIMLAGLMLMAAKPETWTRVNTGSEIRLYERFVKINAGLEVKERRGEMTVNAPVKEVLSLISDPERTAEWMDHVSSADLLRRKSEAEWYTYTCFSLPWPFDNRDMVSLFRCIPNKDGSIVRVEMSSQETTIPLKPNIKRLRNFKASWELIALKAGQTRIAFTAVSFEAPEFPRIIQDKVMRKTFVGNLENFKELLEKK